MCISAGCMMNSIIIHQKPNKKNKFLGTVIIGIFYSNGFACLEILNSGLPLITPPTEMTQNISRAIGSYIDQSNTMGGLQWRRNCWAFDIVFCLLILSILREDEN